MEASKEQLAGEWRLVLVIFCLVMRGVAAAEALNGSTRAVVSQDGSPGSYPTIALALQHAPADDRRPHVIVIRRGIYPETLVITRSNLRLMGEGMGLTIITGNHSKLTGHNTASSATVTLSGEGFMAQDLTIENTAGVDAEQAVALQSSSRRSVFYRCELRGFQDTLWAANYDQFYRSCLITGCVDLIFGNARAFFQDCWILVRKPRPGGHAVVTAQGRDSPDRRSGFVFQGCTVTAANQDPAGAGSTFLGRPWRNHSRVVFMDSFLDHVVNPKGWEQWNATSKIPKTVYYAEFHNSGPGADTRLRVNWTAFHLLNATEAAKFTVRAFLEGQKWLPRFRVPYY